MRDSDGSYRRDGATPDLRIHLLGFPEAHVAGAPLTLSDQKAHALMLYLAAISEARSRDHLATLLWSESPESNARHSLRSSLYHIRHALSASDAADALSVSRSQVSLRLRPDASDLARFRRLIATNDEQRMAEAVALYRGPLCVGVSVGDAPVFEDWLRVERASVAQAYLNTLERLATLAESREAWGEATDYVQRIVQIDPLNEAAQQWLIRLHLQSGAVARALRQYQQFEAELNRELGLAPSHETQALFQRALRRRRTVAPTNASVSPAPWLLPSREERDDEGAAPFVGRDETLAHLLALSDGLRAGRGATVLLHGETGMGKTRLLSEFASRLAAQPPPWTTLVGSCSPFDGLLAYGPFYDALQNAAPGDLSELLSVDQEDARAEAGGAMWRVLQVVRLLTRGGPVMLAIDDLHAANSSTLQLFGFLATHLRNTPALLVGTVDRLDAIPAVRRLLMLGRPRGDVHQVPVTPLTPDAALALLRSLNLSPDMAGVLAEWLQERSGGSPFMMSEILAQLRADAILTPTDGGWRLNEGRWLRRRASFALPETTYDLIAWRLANVSPEALRLLDVLAVAGQPLPFALLHEFPGVQSEQSLETVEDLLSRGLLVESANEAIALPHHLLAEALLARMSHLRRRTLHRQLLEAIERCPLFQARLPLRQVALHAVAAEDVARAQRYGLRILDELLLDAPCAETLSFAQHLHDLLAPTASTSEQLRLTRALGELHQSLGQLDAAKRWRRTQLDIASAADDHEAQAIAHFDMAELALSASDYQSAVAAAEAGLSAATATSRHAELASRGERLIGAALAMEGSDLPAADRYLQNAAAAHRASGNPVDLCAILFELGNVAAQRGELARALASYEEARRAAEAERVNYYCALAQNNFAYHSLLLGQVEAAEDAAKQGLRVAETHELVGALVYLYGTLGEIRLYQADWTQAVDWFDRGLVLAEDLENVERQAGHRAGLALAARGAHDLPRATALLEEALSLIPGQGHWHLRTRIQLWLAEINLLQGKDAEARHSLQQAHSTARSQERALLLIQSERLSARLLADDGDWVAAQALFASAMNRAINLALSLEVARTQATWGEALLRATTPPQQSTYTGRDLLTSAQTTFIAHNAQADLQSLSWALQRIHAR